MKGGRCRTTVIDIASRAIAAKKRDRPDASAFGPKSMAMPKHRPAVGCHRSTFSR